MPDIKISVKEKSEKDSKVTINQNTVTQKAVDEKDMRDFLTEVLTVDTSDLSIKIVDDGYKVYIREGAKSVIDKDDAGAIDNAIETAKNTWNDLDTYTKKIWILKGFSQKKGAPWSRKQFVNRIVSNIHRYTDEDDENKSDYLLDRFIRDYLKSDFAYDKYLDVWLESNKGGKEAKELLD